MNRIKGWARDIRGSLFFLPVLIIALFSAMGVLALLLDAGWASDLGDTPFLVAATVAGGRSIATTVAGATITVAAVVFSITALSSQIAANQYSPRAVRGFFEDPFQQVVIGFVVGTFTYCLLILGGLSTSVVGASEPTPSIAITLTITLGVVSAIGIVAHIDHSLQRFQVDAVVRRISMETLKAVKRQHRDHSRNDSEHQQPRGDPVIAMSNRSGWVQEIDGPKMASTLPDGCVVRLEVRLGEPVSKGDRIGSIWCDAEPERATSALKKSVEIGGSRSLDNDPAFGIRQLVDIALKALSPGINDPTTALDVVHHLKAPVREILVSDPPARVFIGDEGQAVYVSEAMSRSDFVHAAFSGIRLNSRAQPTVLEALLEVLGDLRNHLEAADLSGRSMAVDQEWNLTIDLLVSSGLPEFDVSRVLKGRERVDLPEL
jgi:uncharacterized membrane protein